MAALDRLLAAHEEARRSEMDLLDKFFSRCAMERREERRLLADLLQQQHQQQQQQTMGKGELAEAGATPPSGSSVAALGGQCARGAVAALSATAADVAPGSAAQAVPSPTAGRGGTLAELRDVGGSEDQAYGNISVGSMDDAGTETSGALNPATAAAGQEKAGQGLTGRPTEYYHIASGEVEGALVGTPIEPHRPTGSDENVVESALADEPERAEECNSGIMPPA
jgi:hypothetical protein